jgi:hypothetical protein|tara:strand:- start:153 stop:347 length:195 start_codon:yes stop_codon:yes gene_type:complete
MDKDVLAYSREHAPETRPLPTSLWMPVMTTCSVADLAFLIMINEKKLKRDIADCLNSVGVVSYL